jgi:Ni/Fe-hydrogenase subunit HybB-like protein
MNKIINTVIHEIKQMPKIFYVLAVLTVIGSFAALYRLAFGLGAATNLSNAYPWGLWISFDLTTVALSGGAFTLAAVVYVFQRKEYHPAVYPTVLTGLIGYTSVLIILFMDLGRWDRFYHFTIFPNFHSALFEVSWCIMLYSIVLVYEFSPVLLERLGKEKLIGILKKLTIPFVIAGVTLSTLHQSSLGTLFVVMPHHLHPLWYTILLPMFFYISSICSGLAIVITGSSLMRLTANRGLKQELVAKLGRIIPWILGIYAVMKFADLAYLKELGLLFTSGKYSILFLLEIGIGVVIPFFLFSSHRVRESTFWSLVASLFLLAGVMINRFNTSWWGLIVDPNYHYWPSVTEDLILIGVLSGAILTFLVIARYFPVYEELGERMPKTRMPGGALPAAQSGD